MCWEPPYHVVRRWEPQQRPAEAAAGGALRIPRPTHMQEQDAVWKPDADAPTSATLGNALNSVHK